MTENKKAPIWKQELIRWAKQSECVEIIRLIVGLIVIGLLLKACDWAWS